MGRIPVVTIGEEDLPWKSHKNEWKPKQKDSFLREN